MCGICVMNAVKARMLSRRSFFQATAGGASAMVALAPPVRAEGFERVIDLTHTLSAAFPTFSGEPQFSAEQMTSYDQDGYNLFVLTMDEHTGTHIDAPLHFSADGASVDELPVEDLVAPLCIVDIRTRAQEDADTQVTPDDLIAWQASHGEIPDGACVAMNSGWAGKVGSDAFRNFDGTKQHYPGFHVEAVQMLMEMTGARSIAVDTLSLDHGISEDFATHTAWLPSGRFGIECVAQLDALPPSGATIVVGAPKHAGGTGGPARVLALL